MKKDGGFATVSWPVTVVQSELRHRGLVSYCCDGEASNFS